MSPADAHQSPHDLSLLRLLEPGDTMIRAAERAGGEVQHVGPFLTFLHPDPDAPGFGYAQPLAPLPDNRDTAAGLAALRSVFAKRGAPALVEFNMPLFPGLPEMLEAQGFTLTEHEPLMILDPGDFRPRVVEGVNVRLLGPDDPDHPFSAYDRIFTEVLLERPFRESHEGLGRLRAEAERAGGLSQALATLDGTPVGTGFVAVTDGVAEITRVATVPEARRRGVAATITSTMLEAHFARGVRFAWLTAANEPAQQLYRTLGFRSAGERLYYSSDSPS